MTNIRWLTCYTPDPCGQETANAGEGFPRRFTPTESELPCVLDSRMTVGNLFLLK